LAHYRILRHRPAINAGLEFIGRSTGSPAGEAVNGCLTTGLS
jgi:hypothetical protein